jgi:integrase
MHRALHIALEWGLVGRNVADSVKAPRVPQDERPILTDEQARKLLWALRGDRLHSLYAVALEVGLREGELVARRWSDLDVDKRTLQVRTKLQRETNKGLVEGPTKAKRPRYRVDISPELIGLLSEHRAEQEREAALAGDAAPGDHWRIWCWPDGRDMDPGYVGKHFRQLRERLDLPSGMRFHDLRHTSAALAIAAGEPLEVTADRLGHNDRRTTLGMYGHHMPAASERAAAQRGKRLFGKSEHDERRDAR